MSQPKKQVICVKWGTKYGPEYVNRMYGMLRRNITGDFTLYCFTDDKAGLRAEVVALDLPELGCPHPQRTMGKWRKVVLWGRELAGLSGTALFIDLDSVIVDNIDDYFTHGDPNQVYTARNWAKPMQRLGQTSVFRFPIGANPHILENFRADPQGTADKYHFEQHYITASVKGGIEFWPEGWTKHFRLHCLPPFPLRYFLPAKLPAGTKIVTFPGGPNPADVAVGRWNDTGPEHPGRIAHILGMFSPGRIEKTARRHLMRYVLPVPWLAEHWRE